MRCPVETYFVCSASASADGMSHRVHGLLSASIVVVSYHPFVPEEKQKQLKQNVAKSSKLSNEFSRPSFLLLFW